MNLCKKCLLSEIDENKFFQSILDYVANIPPNEKVNDEVYEQRLSICKECDELVNGMCKKCGCYVELRAAKLFMSCPSEHKLW
ncbi:DUF6171 family protein [Clostridium sp. Marseille-P299]|uniref:DUF6171 family protein n=1 Tax=Clostridium sp. Marseille-P299 TaxID=1805477 RepID=UPI0008344844|nr:DUF6171 family protein [Clostridium sp. Marseille-P299]